jgi:hypothetical protein
MTLADIFAIVLGEETDYSPEEIRLKVGLAIGLKDHPEKWFCELSEDDADLWLTRFRIDPSEALILLIKSDRSDLTGRSE